MGPHEGAAEDGREDDAEGTDDGADVVGCVADGMVWAGLATLVTPGTNQLGRPEEVVEIVGEATPTGEAFLRPLADTTASYHLMVSEIVALQVYRCTCSLSPGITGL